MRNIIILEGHSGTTDYLLTSSLCLSLLAFVSDRLSLRTQIAFFHSRESTPEVNPPIFSYFFFCLSYFLLYSASLDDLVMCSSP